MSATTQRPRVHVLEHIYTAADLAAMPSALPSGPVRYELDNGQLVTLSPPGSDDCALELKLAAALYNNGEQKGYGKVRCGNVKIVLWRNPDRIVVADAVFFASRNLPTSETPQGQLESVPDLVVEVLELDDSRNYAQRKVADCLKAGVAQVWIVDRKSNTLTVHRHGAEPQIVRENETLKANDVIPGFAFELADLFAE